MTNALNNLNTLTNALADIEFRIDEARSHLFCAEAQYEDDLFNDGLNNDDEAKISKIGVDAARAVLEAYEKAKEDLLKFVQPFKEGE